jgi:Protein of unknown function (DUF2442)
MQKLGPLVRVTDVKPLEKYSVQITFQNGVVKDINLEPFLRGEILAPIRNNAQVFRAVKVTGNTIGWENGADIDPYVLYYDLKPAWMEEAEIFPAQQTS